MKKFISFFLCFVYANLMPVSGVNPEPYLGRFI